MESRSAHPVVCFGEVLWDILPSGPLPGGAPMNVAYHLKKLGINPAMISRIGKDDYGHRLISILSDSGIDTKFIAVDHQQPTGLVYANANNRNEVVYDIVYPSAWDFIQWDDAFTDLIRESKYFVFGSLSMRNDVSRNTVEKIA